MILSTLYEEKFEPLVLWHHLLCMYKNLSLWFGLFFSFFFLVHCFTFANCIKNICLPLRARLSWFTRKIRLQVHWRILLEPLVGSSFSSFFGHSVPSAKICRVVHEVVILTDGCLKLRAKSTSLQNVAGKYEFILVKTIAPIGKDLRLIIIIQLISQQLYFQERLKK